MSNKDKKSNELIDKEILLREKMIALTKQTNNDKYVSVRYALKEEILALKKEKKDI